MTLKEKLIIAYEAGAKSVQTNIEINKLIEMGTKQCPEEATFETFLANKNALMPVGESFEQDNQKDKDWECEESCQFYGLNKRGVCCKTWRKFEDKIISDEAITEKANKMEAGTSWCHAYSFEEGAKWHRSVSEDNNPKN